MSKQEQEGFGERLKEALKSANLPQKTLADRLGVSPAAVSQWATGMKECPPGQIKAIAKAIAVDERWLRGPVDVRESGEANGLEEFGWGFRPAPDRGRDYGNSN